MRACVRACVRVCVHICGGQRKRSRVSPYSYHVGPGDRTQVVDKLVVGACIYWASQQPVNMYHFRATDNNLLLCRSKLYALTVFTLREAHTDQHKMTTQFKHLP